MMDETPKIDLAKLKSTRIQGSISSIAGAPELWPEESFQGHLTPATARVIAKRKGYTQATMKHVVSVRDSALKPVREVVGDPIDLDLSGELTKIEEKIAYGPRRYVVF